MICKFKFNDVKLVSTYKLICKNVKTLWSLSIHSLWISILFLAHTFALISNIYPFHYPAYLPFPLVSLSLLYLPFTYRSLSPFTSVPSFSHPLLPLFYSHSASNLTSDICAFHFLIDTLYSRFPVAASLSFYRCLSCHLSLDSSHSLSYFVTETVSKKVKWSLVFLFLKLLCQKSLSCQIRYDCFFSRVDSVFCVRKDFTLNHCFHSFRKVFDLCRFFQYPSCSPRDSIFTSTS